MIPYVQLNHFYLYDAPITVPVFDEDGDLCLTTVPFELRGAADRWGNPVTFPDYPFQECAFHEQIDFMSLSIMTQLFQNIYGTGWGELGGQINANEPGTWIEPQSVFA